MAPLMRLPDWDVRLRRLIQQRQNAAFDWDQAHCGLWAADVVQAITGIDPAAEWRGVTSIKAAMTSLRQRGFRDHIDLASHLLPEIAPAMASDGDLAVVETEQGLGFGVVVGAVIFVRGEASLGTVSRLRASRAFKVG